MGALQGPRDHRRGEHGEDAARRDGPGVLLPAVAAVRQVPGGAPEQGGLPRNVADAAADALPKLNAGSCGVSFGMSNSIVCRPLGVLVSLLSIFAGAGFVGWLASGALTLATRAPPC